MGIIFSGSGVFCGGTTETSAPSSQGDTNNPEPGLFSDKGGYYKFSNGLILQWGYIGNLSSDKFYQISFPISFSHKTLSVTCTSKSDKISENSPGSPIVSSVTKDYFYMNTDSLMGSYGNNQEAYWMAIGY